jgi:alpha-L-rhamnosidase
LWLFVDWSAGLDRETAVHATLAYACGRLAELAEALAEPEIAGRMRAEHAALNQAACRVLLHDGVFVSGPERQVSVASQVWMVLAGAVDPSAGAALLQRCLAAPEAVQPGCPYLQHHLLEALLRCNLTAAARDLLERIWGGMLSRGADTFWEVFDPDDAHCSPYRSHLFNSYCHAWSCSPSWFLRHPVYGPQLMAGAVGQA